MNRFLNGNLCVCIHIYIYKYVYVCICVRPQISRRTVIYILFAKSLNEISLMYLLIHLSLWSLPQICFILFVCLFIFIYSSNIYLLSDYRSIYSSNCLTSTPLLCHYNAILFPCYYMLFIVCVVVEKLLNLMKHVEEGWVLLSSSIKGSSS